MSDEAFEMLSLSMRYVFILLGVIIIIRGLIWIIREQHSFKKELRQLPDAGLIGEMVDMDSGQVYPLPREGYIGNSRDADIRVFGKGVFPHQADFLFVPGKGLEIKPVKGNYTLDGAEGVVPLYAYHGSDLCIGGNILKIRLFAGLDVPDKYDVFNGAEDDPSDLPLPPFPDGYPEDGTPGGMDDDEPPFPYTNDRPFDI